jgi:hypothetical protein
MKMSFRGALLMGYDETMRFFLFLFLVLQLSCSSTQVSREPSATELDSQRVQTRDERMGVNRAFASVKVRKGKPYLFKNVKLAFPDNGKNMLIKDRALSKSAVKGAVDNSPWHERIYGNSDHIKIDQKRFSNANRAYYQVPISESDAVALMAKVKRAPAAEFYYQTQVSKSDDKFKPNQSFETAFDLSSSEDVWLGLLGSDGAQWSEDYYKIWVSPQYRQLIVDLRFLHYLGDIDLKLFDLNKRLIASSQRQTEDEFINITLAKGGFYYIQVSGSNLGNRYDLKYSTRFTGGGDDQYEENDYLKTAFDLSSLENRWLSEIKGEAVAADDDFYRIQVPPGRQQVIVDLRVSVAKGDVDVKLLNPVGELVASSANIGDDDYIDFKVPSPGTYYIKVYPFHTGTSFNMYDLKWRALKP